MNVVGIPLAASVVSMLFRRFPIRVLTAKTVLESFFFLCLLVGVTTTRAQQNPGSVDTTFSTNGGALGRGVFSIAVQPDGKILVAGGFTFAGGVARTSLARFNQDGSLDTAFDPVTYNSGSSDAGQVNSVALQADGKILIGGVYTAVDGVDRNGPVRLNTDGSLDTGYDTTNNVYYVNGLDYTVVPQTDGKVLVGIFNGIERTNADGSADSTFRPSSGDGSYNTGGDSNANDGSQVFAIAVQPDGKIVLGGHFLTFAGVAYPSLARLNPDGSLDTSFNPAFTLSQYGSINGVAVQSDGKILYAGKDYDAATENTPGVVGRLNADGSVDPDFQPGFSADSVVNTVVVQGDGKLLVGGGFNTIRGAAHKGFARLNADGSLDTAFLGGIDTSDSANDDVYPIALQPNGKILLGGTFDAVDGSEQTNIARLNGDHLPFFDGEAELDDAVYYLAFPDENYFGYYSYLADPHYLYHFDLGYEYVFDAADGKAGVYFYDLASGGFFYTSPGFPFPYLYDFTLDSVLYYYPDPNDTGHYNTNGIRYFYEFKTGKIISK